MLGRGQAAHDIALQRDAQFLLFALIRDTFSRNTCNQLKQVFDALRELITPPDPPRRPIGFVIPEDTRGKKIGGKARLKT